MKKTTFIAACFLFLASFGYSSAAEARRRTISTEEYQFALSLFEREFPRQYDIIITDNVGYGGRPYVRPTIDGEILVNLGRNYDNPLASKKLFAHELTHVWQIKHYGLTWYGKQAVRNQVVSGAPYSYVCDPKKGLNDYNAEQQAEIVAAYSQGKACETAVTSYLRSETWKLLIGSEAIDVAVGMDGVYYLVNNEGSIYKYTGIAWQKLSGSDGRSIASNAGKVFLTNSEGEIYQLVGTKWKQMPGSDGKDIAIDSDGSVWLLDTGGKIYKFNGTKWNRMPGSDGARISAGGGQVWLIDTGGKIYKFNGTKWNRMPGSSGRDITVSNEGAIFLTNTSGKIYQWNNGSWLQLDGSDGFTVSANAKKLILTNTKGRIYFRVW
jgi:hypothetical protein